MFSEMRNRFFLIIKNFFLLFIILVYLKFLRIYNLHKDFFFSHLHYMQNCPSIFLPVNYLPNFLFIFSFLTNLFFTCFSLPHHIFYTHYHYTGQLFFTKKNPRGAF